MPIHSTSQDPSHDVVGYSKILLASGGAALAAQAALKKACPTKLALAFTKLAKRILNTNVCHETLSQRLSWVKNKKDGIITTISVLTPASIGCFDHRKSQISIDNKMFTTIEKIENLAKQLEFLGNETLENKQEISTLKAKDDENKEIINAQLDAIQKLSEENQNLKIVATPITNLGWFNKFLVLTISFVACFL